MEINATLSTHSTALPAPNYHLVGGRLPHWPLQEGLAPISTMKDRSLAGNSRQFGLKPCC
jgi:hypothetical protein